MNLYSHCSSWKRITAITYFTSHKEEHPETITEAETANSVPDNTVAKRVISSTVDTQLKTHTMTTTPSKILKT